jgi:hypothetical protein
MSTTCHVHPIVRTSSPTADTKDLVYFLIFLSSKINHFSACTGLKWLQRSLSHLSCSSCTLYSMLFVTCLHPFYFHIFVLLCVHSGLMFSAMLYTLVSLCLSPRWCSDQCFCHWTQASWVQTRPRGWIFKGDKIHSIPSFGLEVKAEVPCRKILWHVKDPLRYDRDIYKQNSATISHPLSPRFANRRLCWNQSREISWVDREWLEVRWRA